MTTKGPVYWAWGWMTPHNPASWIFMTIPTLDTRRLKLGEAQWPELTGLQRSTAETVTPVITQRGHHRS